MSKSCMFRKLLDGTYVCAHRRTSGICSFKTTRKSNCITHANKVHKVNKVNFDDWTKIYWGSNDQMREHVQIMLQSAVYSK